MDHNVIAIAVRDAVGKDRTVAPAKYTELSLGTKDNRFAVTKLDEHCISIGLAGDVFKCGVVKDVAVLVDLNQRGALVLGGTTEHLLHVCTVHVMRTGHESSLCSDRKSDGIKGCVYGTNRCRLGDLPLL